MITPIQCATMHSGLTEQEVKEKYGWVLRALNEYGSRCVYDFLEGNSPEPAKHKPFIVGNVRDLLDELKEEITFNLFVEKLNAIARKFYEGASEGMAEALTVEHVRELYTSETGEGWLVTPVCHGEKGFASWEYQLWLERKLASLSPGVEDGSGWVKVEDGLPEVLETVWISNGKGWTTLGCRSDYQQGDDGELIWCWCATNGTIYEEDGKIVAECEEDDWDVRHWRPLPAPPG